MNMIYIPHDDAGYAYIICKYVLVALITAVLRYRSFQASDRNSPGGNAGSGANVRNANEPTFACVCVCVRVCVRVCACVC
jgi:hypothetical protein